MAQQVLAHRRNRHAKGFETRCARVGGSHRIVKNCHDHVSPECGLVLAIHGHTALSMIAPWDCVGAELYGTCSFCRAPPFPSWDCKLLPMRDVSVRCNEHLETGSLRLSRARGSDLLQVAFSLRHLSRHTSKVVQPSEPFTNAVPTGENLGHNVGNTSWVAAGAGRGCFMRR